MSYFLITCSEDGLSIERYPNEDTLLEGLKEHTEADDLTPAMFLYHLPNIDNGSWDADDDAMLIIKGDIITPIFQRVVTKIKLP